MNKFRLIILVFMISCGIGNAQSVETFIDMAKEYNPLLKSLRLEYEAALLKEGQVNDWPDPKVNIGIGLLPVETRLGPQRFKIGVSQMIPWKGILEAQSAVARSKAEVKSNLDYVKEIDIEYAIRTAYSSLQFLESTKSIIQQRLKVLDVLTEIAKSTVSSGQGKLSNVLFIERQREIYNADLALIYKKMEQPTIMINRWAGRDLSTEIIINKILPDLVSSAEAKEFAASDHPQYQIYDNQVEASNAVIALTNFQTKPKISLGLDYAYVDTRKDVNVSGNGRDIFMPMGSISIPLHKGRYKAIRQEEAIRQEAIKVKREEVRDMYYSEIEIAASMIEYSNQIISKFKTLKEITYETIKLMRTEYASEGTRFEELLRLEMELIDYDLEILKAEYEKNLANATLYKFKSK